MPIGRDFGQVEPLTSRLHNLVRSYPKGLGILKEFIQNADDAGAEEISFVIDESTYDITGLPDSMHWLHKTPALLVYNNKPFSDEDLIGIQRIGKSGKVSSVGKTGRYGLGFNACYNVTDIPYFFTKGELHFFDPHSATIPNATESHPGRSFNTDELAEEGWPLLEAFSRFNCDADTFTGAVFRLPFRMENQVSTSKIKHEAYTVDDALKAVDDLKEMGAAMLLFLKNVKQLRVEYRKRDGSSEVLLSIRAKNQPEITRSRENVNKLLNSSDPEHILTVLTNHGSSFSSCHHEYSVEINGIPSIEKWRVIDGFFADEEGKVIDACRSMIENEEKALPYAGAAWQLGSNPSSVGRIFCFLPVPVQTTMPVQVNGYFDLDDSRQNMFLDEKTSGRDRRRFEWNKALLENSVAQAYVQLLKDLREDLGREDIDSYYKAFPEAVDKNSSWENWLTSSFYNQVADTELFRCSGESTWKKLSEVRSLPGSLISISAALIAENFLSIPSPSLPRHVRNGLKSNLKEIPILSPSELRGQLKVQEDVNCHIADAPFACLSKRENIIKICQFCFSDKLDSDVDGLPLLIDGTGKLRTIGVKSLFLQETELDRDVFWNNPQIFIDPDFSSEANLLSIRKGKIYSFDIKLFLDALAICVSKPVESNRSKITEGKDGSGVVSWLKAVFKRLLFSYKREHEESLYKIPLIPDQTLTLHSMGSSATPLIFNGSKNLRQALTEFDVPLVSSVDNELLSLITEFAKKFDCIWSVTPHGLIDTLVDERKEVIAEYDSATNVQHALLDYLSEEDNLADLNKFSDRQVKLKSLKIFPMANGNLVDLSEVAYTSESFSFPAVELDVVLLQDGGTQRQWRKLYALLGVQKLSRLRLIINYILPKFIDFTVEERQSTLIWLRDNLSQAQSENDNAGISTVLLENVRTARLITCENGEVKAPMNVYQPDSKLAKSVLGNQVSLPDMKVTFFSETDRWLAFFRQLDMPVEPQLDDVVEYVKVIVLDAPSAKRIESIRTIYKFIKDRLDNEIPDISDELSLAIDKLAEIQWVPLRQKAGDLLCFKAPEQAYAYSREAYFPRVAQLVSSQSYITSLSPEPSPQVRRAMGFPEKPSLDSVISHFQALLAICENPDAMPKDSFLTKALGTIYRFFGEEAKSGDLKINLADTFIDIPCLWDQEKQVFWRPNHVFTDKVRYMEPWRCSIRSEDDSIEQGYKALGRVLEPSIDDWMAVLEEISDSGLPIQDQKNGKVIKEVIGRIVEELNRNHDSNDSVLVPTYSGFMVESKHVFMHDAPWYEYSLDDWDIPVLDNSISGILGIQPTLKISSLAESVDERLTETPIDSDLTDESLECARLEGLLRSSDFISGLRRLLKHEGKEMPEMSLSYLHSIRVICVKNIQVGLYLYIDEAERFLGEDMADFYWESNNQTAMLVENRGRYFCDDLASLLNRSLQDCLLSNLSPLVHILKCEPSEISSTLDALKIRQFVFESENEPVDEYDDYSNFQEFPKDEIEMQSKQEEFESFDSNPARDEFDINDSLHEKKSSFDDSENARPYTDNQSHPFSTGKHSQEKGSQDPSNSRSGNPQISTASGSSNVSNKSNIDIEKGSSSHSNRTSTAGVSHSSSKQRRLVSYVAHGDEPNTKTETRPDTNNKRMTIGDKAVEIVIKYEQKHGRTARSMAHFNKGYDVISEDGDTSRYIEVKGTEAAWGERGVSMSHPQFFYTLQNPEREHWLYVVENTFSQTPTLHKIPSPSEIVTSFVFDGGWRQVAESVPLNTEDDEPLPSRGDKVLKEGEVVGIVKSIIQSGKLPLVIYQDLDGNEKKQLLKKLNFKKGMPDG